MWGETMTETITLPRTHVEEEEKVKRQPPYNVILLNDDDHTYQYVITMLQTIFGYPPEIRFYLDPETQQPHIYEHGVTEEEVSQILRRPTEDRARDEDSRVAIGQTMSGRYLKVIYSRDP